MKSTKEFKRAESEEEVTVKRQAVSGRNAYEIRADVLQMAIDWTTDHNEWGKKTEDDALALAKKFYQFVENRR